MTTPEDRKARFTELHRQLRPLDEAVIAAQIELVALTVDIALDEILASFPSIEVKETIFPRVGNRKPDQPAPTIIADLISSGITPKMAIVDRNRMTIAFVV